MSTLNLIIICITAMAIAAIAGATIENVFRIIYDDYDNLEEKAGDRT